jgi:hypothetical protein
MRLSYPKMARKRRKESDILSDRRRRMRVDK